MSDRRAPVALYDANVLYPSFLRDVLMRLAVADLVRARWTDAIHDEWGRHLLENRPDIPATAVARIRTLMEHALPDARVTGYEPLLDRVALPDPDDRHVLAAAVQARAQYIVTLNQSDFPASALAPHGIEAIPPDALLTRLLEHDPETTIATLERQRRGFARPPMTPVEYLDVLDCNDLAGAASRIRTEFHSVWEAHTHS